MAIRGALSFLNIHMAKPQKPPRMLKCHAKLSPGSLGVWIQQQHFVKATTRLYCAAWGGTCWSSPTPLFYRRNRSRDGRRLAQGCTAHWRRSTTRTPFSWVPPQDSSHTAHDSQSMIHGPAALALPGKLHKTTDWQGHLRLTESESVAIQKSKFLRHTQFMRMRTKVWEPLPQITHILLETIISINYT